MRMGTWVYVVGNSFYVPANVGVLAPFIMLNYIITISWCVPMYDNDVCIKQKYALSVKLQLFRPGNASQRFFAYCFC